MSSPKAEVQAFRKEKYQLDETTGRSMLQQDAKADLHNSVNIISEQLYSRDVHFVFELIQNAEDNHYATGVAPRLHFELLDKDPTGTEGSYGCLAIFNNEQGFTFSNVKAVSSIGKSTKAASKDAGYIGEKGIGFKSVFSVSPSPHIFSNGYHFLFKDKDEATGLGYIIPYWIDQVPELVQERLNAYTTCILLPLRADPEQDVRQKIKKELNSLDPSVLLFLNKLQELTIVIDGQLRRYSKQVSADATTLLTQQGDVIESIEYLVCKKIVSVPNDLREDKRQGVVKRDICLAFRKDLDSSHKPDHHLYAYLPTELKTGLPFLVNADFLLPASRESVLTDKKWNLWMRDEVASFAAETLVDLLIETNSVDALAQIPMLENCNNEFLRPIFEVILEQLEDTAFIPSISGLKNKPAQICFADEKITNLLAKLENSEIDLPARVLALNAHPYMDVLKQLYDAMLDSDEIFTYCNAAKIKLLQLPDNWFVSILNWLSEQDDTFHDKADKNGIKILHKVPLFITEQGIVSCHEQVIFLSSNTHMEYPVLATLESQTNHGLLTNEFQKALEGKQKVINFIKDYFNIQILSQSEYLEKVALPFCVAKCDEILPETLWQLNRFIAQHWFSISDVVKNMLRAKLPFKNSVGGYELSNERQLVTPEADELSFIWKNVFSTEEQKQFLVLSDDYLELFEKFEKLEKNEFYKVMKITAAPLPNIVKVTKPSRYHKAEFADSNFSESYINKTSKAINKIDSTSAIHAKFHNLPAICKTPELFFNERLRKSFLYWLLDVESKLLTPVAINYYYRSNGIVHVESALLYWLKNNQWLPTQNGLMRPDETFISSQGSRELYGNAVNFLENDYSLSTVLAQKLGVSSEVNSETVLNLLRSWSKHNQKVSMSTVIKLYERLADTRSDLASLFAAEALIYCPSGERNWCASSMAIWKSQKDVLGEVFHWLSDFYPDHKQAFWLNNIKVQQNPDAKCFADVWLDLQILPLEDKDNNGSLRLKLAVIYERLISYIRDKGINNLEPWFSHFVEHALCFTQNYRWENRDVTYVSDDKKVASLFKDKVEFFWRTRGKSHSDFKLLYDALRLKTISEEVSVAVTFDTEQLKVPTKPVLTEYSRLLLAYYFKQFISKSGKPEEKWYESPGIYDVLTVKEYQICSYMKVTYKVHHFTVKTDVDVTFERNAGFLIYNAENKDVDDLLDDLAEEVSKLIVKKSFVEEQDHIRALLNVQTVERYNKRIEMMHLDNVLTQEEIEIIKMLHLSQDASEPLNTEHADSNGTPGAEVTIRNPSVIDHSRIDNPEPVEQDSDTPHKFIGIGTNSPSQTNSKSGKTSSSNTANGYSPSNEGITATPTGRSIKQGSEREKDEGASRKSSSSEKVRSDDKQPSVPQSSASSGFGDTAQKIRSPTNNGAPNYRMVSYVENSAKKESNSDNEKAKQLRAKRIGDKAEYLVAEYLEKAGFKVEHLGGINPGFDISATDTLTGELFFVEVKGMLGFWNLMGFSLSKTQMQKCQEHGDNYWLMIVENIGSNPYMYKLINPAAKIDSYCFDSNWKHIADNSFALNTIEYSGDNTGLAQEINGGAGVLDDDFFYCPKHKDLYIKCLDLAIGAPDIGFEFQDNYDAIVCELEFAWPKYKKGVFTTETKPCFDGWEFKTVDEVLTDLSWLDI